MKGPYETLSSEGHDIPGPSIACLGCDLELEVGDPIIVVYDLLEKNELDKSYSYILCVYCGDEDSAFMREARERGV